MKDFYVLLEYFINRNELSLNIFLMKRMYFNLYFLLLAYYY